MENIELHIGVINETPKFGIIYIYTCLITRRSYIGKTIRNLQKRAGYNGCNYLATDTKFSRAIKEYGWHTFIPRILGTFSLEKLDFMEQYFIAYYNTYNDGYNATIGGMPDKYSMPQETRLKIGNGNRGKKRSKKTRAKMAKSKKGKKLSKEWIENSRLGHLGQKAWNKGVPHTEETRKKISKANTGRKASEESKQKISVANKGKKRTKETREKMGKVRQRRVAQYTLNNELIKIHDGITAASKETGTNKGHLCEAAQGKRKTANGFIWKYVD